MEYKDKSLLRPFDAEAAKAGEPICWSAIEDDVTFFGVNSKGCVAYESAGDSGFTSPLSFRMKPLCWLHGKPVYKGDVLYYNVCGSWHKHVADAMTEDDKAIDQLTGSEYDRGFVNLTSLYWEPGKTKKEGWINIYPNHDGEAYITSSVIHPTKEVADKDAAHSRITCIKIEYEV